MNVPDVTSEFRFVPGQQEQGFRSVLRAEVRDGVSIGVIGVSRMVVGPFPENQVELLCDIGSWAGQRPRLGLMLSNPTSITCSASWPATARIRASAGGSWASTTNLNSWRWAGSGGRIERQRTPGRPDVVGLEIRVVPEDVLLADARCKQV